MKCNSKSAAIMMGAILTLAGCSSLGLDDIKWPKVTSGVEVPDEILNEPRIVQTPTIADKTNPQWPRLGDVPAKPTNFTPEPIIQETMGVMEQERNAALARREQVENPPPFVLPSTSQ